jgi:hypothetical protein
LVDTSTSIARRGRAFAGLKPLAIHTGFVILSAMKVSAQYLAGFFDGEGCITMRHRTSREGRPQHIQIEANITNTNRDVLALIQSDYGGSLHTHQNKHRAIHRLRWTSKDAIYALLKKVFPYLVIKRSNAELMLEYIKARPAHRRSRLTVDDISFAGRMTTLNETLRFRQTTNHDLAA